MKITKISNKYLKTAKSYNIASDRIYLYTGKRVIVLDNNFEYLDELDNLAYVYHGNVSPDEKRILLVSTQNKFYVVSLTDHVLRKCIIKQPFNYNLEGRGCWNTAGDAVYIPVQNHKTGLSTLRKYFVDKNFEFEDVMSEKLWIVHIDVIHILKKHIIIGKDRQTDIWNIVLYDENGFDFYEIEDFDDAVLNVRVNENDKTIDIYGMYMHIKRNFYGKKVQNKTHNLVERYSLTNINHDERINSVCVSNDARYYLVGTTKSLIVVDAIDNAVILKQHIDYGVQKILELKNNIFIASTWNGVCGFKLED